MRLRWTWDNLLGAWRVAVYKGDRRGKEYVVPDRQAPTFVGLLSANAQDATMASVVAATGAFADPHTHSVAIGGGGGNGLVGGGDGSVVGG